MNEDLPMLKEFILPSGSLSCSYAHQARAVCRCDSARAALSLYRKPRRHFRLVFQSDGRSYRVFGHSADWLRSVLYQKPPFRPGAHGRFALKTRK